MCITEEGVFMNLENMWKSFLERIKNKISNISYETWFSETKLIDLTENKAIVQVPYHVHKKNLSENYIDIIEETFQEVTGTNFKFEFLLEEEVEKNIDSARHRAGLIQHMQECRERFLKFYTLFLSALRDLIACRIHDHTGMIIVFVDHVLHIPFPPVRHIGRVIMLRLMHIPAVHILIHHQHAEPVAYFQLIF